jgi:glycosyltransferase involved in cell wall biosynthesis
MIDGLGIGGAESHLVSLLNVFDYVKYKVDVLRYRKNGVFEQYIPKNVNILSIPGFFENPPRTKGSEIRHLFSRFMFGTGRRINTRKRRPLHDSQIFWKYYSNCIESLPQKYDFAIAFGQGFPCYYVAEKVNADFKLLSINNDLEADGYDADFNSTYFLRYNYILPVTEALKRLLIKSYGHFSDKMFVYENTFNPEFMIRLSENETAFSDNYNGKRIVSVGRYAPQKGWDMAIKAANILRERNVEFKWYIVGYGFFQPELERLIASMNLKEHVILTGMQLNPFKFLNEADIYVQTSRYEGFCRTIKEAKVFRLPIVTTNFSVVYEQITNRMNGLIVDMDENSIAKGIEELLSNPGLQQLFIENILKEPITTSKEEFEKFEKFLTSKCDN